jgi:hypothetical protein
VVQGFARECKDLQESARICKQEVFVKKKKNVQGTTGDGINDHGGAEHQCDKLDEGEVHFHVSCRSTGAPD